MDDYFCLGSEEESGFLQDAASRLSAAWHGMPSGLLKVVTSPRDLLPGGILEGMNDAVRWVFFTVDLDDEFRSWFLCGRNGCQLTKSRSLLLFAVFVIFLLIMLSKTRKRLSLSTKCRYLQKSSVSFPSLPLRFQSTGFVKRASMVTTSTQVDDTLDPTLAPNLAPTLALTLAPTLAPTLPPILASTLDTQLTDNNIDSLTDDNTIRNSNLVSSLSESRRAVPKAYRRAISFCDVVDVRPAEKKRRIPLTSRDDQNGSHRISPRQKQPMSVRSSFSTLCTDKRQEKQRSPFVLIGPKKSRTRFKTYKSFHSIKTSKSKLNSLIESDKKTPRCSASQNQSNQASSQKSSTSISRNKCIQVKGQIGAPSKIEGISLNKKVSAMKLSKKKSLKEKTVYSSKYNSGAYLIDHERPRGVVGRNSVFSTSTRGIVNTTNTRGIVNTTNTKGIVNPPSTRCIINHSGTDRGTINPPGQPIQPQAKHEISTGTRGTGIINPPNQLVRPQATRDLDSYSYTVNFAPPRKTDTPVIKSFLGQGAFTPMVKDQLENNDSWCNNTRRLSTVAADYKGRGNKTVKGDNLLFFNNYGSNTAARNYVAKRTVRPNGVAIDLSRRKTIGGDINVNSLRSVWHDHSAHTNSMEVSSTSLRFNKEVRQSTKPSGCERPIGVVRRYSTDVPGVRKENLNFMLSSRPRWRYRGVTVGGVKTGVKTGVKAENHLSSSSSSRTRTSKSSRKHLSNSSIRHALENGLVKTRHPLKSNSDKKHGTPSNGLAKLPMTLDFRQVASNREQRNETPTLCGNITPREDNSTKRDNRTTCDNKTRCGNTLGHADIANRDTTICDAKTPYENKTVPENTPRDSTTKCDNRSTRDNTLATDGQAADLKQTAPASNMAPPAGNMAAKRTCQCLLQQYADCPSISGCLSSSTDETKTDTCRFCQKVSRPLMSHRHKPYEMRTSRRNVRHLKLRKLNKNNCSPSKHRHYILVSRDDDATSIDSDYPSEMDMRLNSGADSRRIIVPGLSGSGHKRVPTLSGSGHKDVPTLSGSGHKGVHTLSGSGHKGVPTLSGDGHKGVRNLSSEGHKVHHMPGGELSYKQHWSAAGKSPRTKHCSINKGLAHRHVQFSPTKQGNTCEKTMQQDGSTKINIKHEMVSPGSYTDYLKFCHSKTTSNMSSIPNKKDCLCGEEQIQRLIDITKSSIKEETTSYATYLRHCYANINIPNRSLSKTKCVSQDILESKCLESSCLKNAEVQTSPNLNSSRKGLTKDSSSQCRSLVPRFVCNKFSRQTRLGVRPPFSRVPYRKRQYEQGSNKIKKAGQKKETNNRSAEIVSCDAGNKEEYIAKDRSLDPIPVNECSSKQVLDTLNAALGNEEHDNKKHMADNAKDIPDKIPNMLGDINMDEVEPRQDEDEDEEDDDNRDQDEDEEDDDKSPSSLNETYTIDNDEEMYARPSASPHARSSALPPKQTSPLFTERFMQRPMWQNVDIHELDRRVQRALKLREELQLRKEKKDSTPTTIHIIQQIEQQLKKEVAETCTEDLRPSDTDEIPSCQLDTTMNLERKQLVCDVDHKEEKHEKTIRREHNSPTSTIASTIVLNDASVSDQQWLKNEKSVDLVGQVLYRDPPPQSDFDQKSCLLNTESVQKSQAPNASVHELSDAECLDILTDEINKMQRRRGRHSSVGDYSTHRSSNSVNTCSLLTDSSIFTMKNSKKNTTFESDNPTPQTGLRLIGELVERLPKVPTQSMVDWFLATSDPRDFERLSKSGLSSNSSDYDICKEVNSTSVADVGMGNFSNMGPRPKSRLKSSIKTPDELTNTTYTTPPATPMKRDTPSIPNLPDDTCIQRVREGYPLHWGQYLGRREPSKRFQKMKERKTPIRPKRCMATINDSQKPSRVRKELKTEYNFPPHSGSKFTENKTSTVEPQITSSKNEKDDKVKETFRRIPLQGSPEPMRSVSRQRMAHVKPFRALSQPPPFSPRRHSEGCVGRRGDDGGPNGVQQIIMKLRNRTESVSPTSSHHDQYRITIKKKSVKGIIAKFSNR